MNTLVALCAVGAEKILGNEIKHLGYKLESNEGHAEEAGHHRHRICGRRQDGSRTARKGTSVRSGLVRHVDARHGRRRTRQTHPGGQAPRKAEGVFDHRRRGGPQNLQGTGLRFVSPETRDHQESDGFLCQLLPGKE